MINNLVPPTEDQPDPRGELDRALLVDQWAVPGGVYIPPPPVTAPIPDVPDWWEGDEQASQEFLRAVGVTL